MYRPIIAGKKHLYEIAPYEGSDKWADVMKDAPVNVALGAIVFFLSFREQIVKIYDELFTGAGEDRGEYSLEAGFGRKWGWYQSIYGLAGGDVHKLESVTKVPLHTCLMWLSFEKEKNEIESKIIKQSYNKNI